MYIGRGFVIIDLSQSFTLLLSLMKINDSLHITHTSLSIVILLSSACTIRLQITAVVYNSTLSYKCFQVTMKTIALCNRIHVSAAHDYGIAIIR